MPTGVKRSVANKILLDCLEQLAWTEGLFQNSDAVIQGVLDSQRLTKVAGDEQDFDTEELLSRSSPDRTKLLWYESMITTDGESVGGPTNHGEIRQS
jgi:hypothetical protein